MMADFFIPQNEIKVSTKNVYGNELVYPNCQQSKMFCQLNMSKTLTEHMIAVLKKYNYKIIVEPIVREL